MSDHETEVNAAAELALKADKNVPVDEIATEDGREYILYRSDFTMKEVTAPNAAEVHKPKLVTQAVQVQTVDSFVEYTDRMKNDDSVIFADMNSNVILGVIDYHRQPPNHTDAGGSVEPLAELTKHTVTLALPYSIEWRTWLQLNNRLVSHKDFATFLEENSLDVLPLPKRVSLATSEEDADMPESMLELTRALQVTNKVNFNSVVRHGDYERIEFAKESDATAKGAVGLPVSFQIRIPVYFGEASVVLTCFTRKKVDDGVLSIGYSINRHENVRQDEFQRIVGAIAGSTELTTLFGKPSA